VSQSLEEQPAVALDKPVSATTTPSPPVRKKVRVLGRDLGLDRFAGLYVAVILAIVFSIWNPATFGTLDNARIIASSEAITGILTLGLIVSLISGMFDVSIAANMSLAISLVGWLQSNFGMNPLLAVILTLLSGALVGASNAFVITKLHVEPVIATLGMSSILVALAYWIAQGSTIIDGISPTFKDFGSAKILTIPVPVFYLLAVAALLWYVLEHTPTGRYLYAAGANARAARLAGLKVIRLQWGALIVAGTLASFAGIVLTMQLGASSFGAGGSYLLPAFAAAFLGSTQVRPGRFNVLGTLVALYLMAIGVKGLQLEYPELPWIKDLFEGLTLIFAVALGARAALRRASR
jgi:ribose transport system permease protein